VYVEEAGGMVTCANGKPLPFQMSSVLATNTKLHPALLEITARHHPTTPPPR
jgi:myo-inositol-1(or 4)-monophosphatase